MVIKGIALKELRSWAPGINEEDIVSVEAACAELFQEHWLLVPSLIQHVCVHLKYFDQMDADLLNSIIEMDKEAIDTLIDATSCDYDHKQWLKSRVQLHWDDVVNVSDPAVVTAGPVTEEDVIGTQPSVTTPVSE